MSKFTTRRVINTVGEILLWIVIILMIACPFISFSSSFKTINTDSSVIDSLSWSSGGDAAMQQVELVLSIGALQGRCKYMRTYPDYFKDPLPQEELCDEDLVEATGLMIDYKRYPVLEKLQQMMYWNGYCSGAKMTGNLSALTLCLEQIDTDDYTPLP